MTEDIGTHSIQKCAVIYVANGCTISPTMSSIFIQENWTIGGVEDIYIKYEKAGDQFVARTVSVLPIPNKEFSISPPYFDYSDLEDYERDMENDYLDDWILQRVPND